MQFIYTNNLDLLVIFGSVSIMMLMTYLLTRSIIENKSNGLRKYNEKVNEYINSIINHSSEFKDLVSIDINSAAIAENSFEDEVYLLRKQVQTKDEKLAYFEKSVSCYQEESEELQEKIKELEITEKDLIRVETLTNEKEKISQELESLISSKNSLVRNYEGKISTILKENQDLKSTIENLKTNTTKSTEVEKTSWTHESEKLVSILNLVDSKSNQEKPSDIEDSNDAKIVKLEKVTENMDKDEIIDVFKKLLAS